MKCVCAHVWPVVFLNQRSAQCQHEAARSRQPVLTACLPASQPASQPAVPARLLFGLPTLSLGGSEASGTWIQVRSVSLLWEKGSDCQTWLEIILLIKQALAKQSPSHCLLRYSHLKRAGSSSTKSYRWPFKGPFLSAVTIGPPHRWGWGLVQALLLPKDPWEVGSVQPADGSSLRSSTFALAKSAVFTAGWTSQDNVINQQSP